MYKISLIPCFFYCRTQNIMPHEQVKEAEKDTRTPKQRLQDLKDKLEQLKSRVDVEPDVNHRNRTKRIIEE